MCFTYLHCISSYLHSHFHSFCPQRSDLRAERVILTILHMVAAVLWPRVVVIWPLQISLDFFPSKLIFSKVLQTRSSNQSQVVKSPNSFFPSFPLVCTGHVCWHHKTLFPFSAFPYFFLYLKSFKKAFTLSITQHLFRTLYQTPISIVFMLLKKSGELLSS